MKINFPSFTFYFLLLPFAFQRFSQTLSVRDIMREPSIAGMRADGEKLSPDGKTVIFSWNAEGKEPRNLYIVGHGRRAAKFWSTEENY